MDVSFFGGAREYYHGGGTASRIPFFGLLKRVGKVHVVLIQNGQLNTLLPIIPKTIQPDSIIYTGGFADHDPLDISGFHHHWITHSEEFVEARKYINGIENLWN